MGCNCGKSTPAQRPVTRPSESLNDSDKTKRIIRRSY